MEGENPHNLPEGPESPDSAASSGTPRARGISRKTMLKAAAAVGPAAMLLGSVPALARDRRAATGAQRPLAPTPSCDDGDDPTPPQMEGPYFKPNSPERTDLLEPGATRLTVSGFIFSRTCEPLPDVLLDFWQADQNGAYDNVGYRYRGHQFSRSDGAFQLTTGFPGLYPGRTRHLHVKVQAPNQRVLTTQLYFPGEPGNNSDPIFDPALLMNVRDVGGTKEASFDFVLTVS